MTVTLWCWVTESNKMENLDRLAHYDLSSSGKQEIEALVKVSVLAFLSNKVCLAQGTADTLHSVLPKFWLSR